MKKPTAPAVGSCDCRRRTQPATKDTSPSGGLQTHRRTRAILTKVVNKQAEVKGGLESPLARIAEMKLLGRLLYRFALLLLVAFVGLTLAGAFYEPAVGPLPGGDRCLEVEGTTIRYRQAGTGRDILLVHGSPGSVEDWAAVWDRLATRYRVTAYDRPGHGYSGAGARGDTLAHNARVARGLIAVLGLRDVVFVGHSYGGATALRLAVENPPEVSAFVLVGARGYDDINVEPIYRLIAIPWLGTGFARVTGALIAPRIIREGIASSFDPNAAAMPEGFVEQRVGLWSQPTVAVAAALERVGLGTSLAEIAPRYPGIAKPVFIVVGDHDAKPLVSAARLAHEIPGARLVSLPNTGHYVQYARPGELLRVIDAAAASEAPDP